jgi:hypothetical protein
MAYDFADRAAALAAELERLLPQGVTGTVANRGTIDG